MDIQHNSNLLIRKATITDVPVIREIAHQTWPVTYASILSKNALEYMLHHFYSVDTLQHQFNANHLFFIAELKGKAIGFSSTSEIKPGVYKLHKLYVLPHHHKCGAGKALLNNCLEIAKADKASEIILNVNRFNAARGFYEKMGFSIIAEEDIDLGNGVVQEDYVMKLKL